MRKDRRFRWRTAASLVLAVFIVAALQSTAMAQQDQINATKATAQPKPAGDVKPVVVQPPAKPQVGPPAPAETIPARGGKPGAAAPQPTVQLKPGEVPGIKFDTPTYDFGRVPAGQDVLHDFWFTNTGNGPLEILAAKPS
jgi:hypothetical protein